MAEQGLVDCANAVGAVAYDFVDSSNTNICSSADLYIILRASEI